MWRFGLAALGAIFFINCSTTITCNPELGPTAAGCPASAPVCDPNGICRKLCFGDDNGCPDAGTVCDTSVSSQFQNQVQICQTSCSGSNPCAEVNGQPQVCFTYQLKSTGGDPPPPVGICKRAMPGYNVGNTYAWCQLPFQPLDIGGAEYYCGAPVSSDVVGQPAKTLLTGRH